MLSAKPWPNPITKTKPPRISPEQNAAGWSTVFFTGRGPWNATCFSCGEVIRGSYTRKVAKDRLHNHTTKSCRAGC